MCFYKNKSTDTVRVARRDIKVYKQLHRKRGKYLSPVYGQEWERKKVVTSQLTQNAYSSYVYAGLHAFRKRRHAGGYGGTVYSFIIPRGAKYFMNDTQYVSDKMYMLSGIPLKRR